LFAAATLLAPGCAEENPDLVNPPSQSELVYVRFINFAMDREDRALVMEDTKSTATTAFGNTSPAIHPPQDSAFMAVQAQGGQEYKLPRRMKFVRNINYTMIGMPSPEAIRNNKPLDSMITITTTTTIPEDTRQAYIRMFNAFPDTTAKFELRLGCPNGRRLASNLNYMRMSGVFDVRAGQVAVSLIKIVKSHEEIIGLYRMDVEPGGQYLVMPAPAHDGTLDFLLLDQNSLTVDALGKMNYVEQRTTQIRPVNFSSKSVDIEKMPGEIVSMGMQPGTIGDYATLTACGSQTADSIIVTQNSATASITAAALEVLQKYTLIVADSADKRADQAILIEPALIDEDPNGRAIVRVVNAAYKRDQLTLTLGARNDSAFQNGYNSGYVMAEKLPYGGVSTVKYVEPGPAPIALFTAGAPAKLLYTSNFEFIEGGSYLMVVTSDDMGNDRITVIEDEIINQNIQYIEEGVFTQIVNALPGKEKISVSVEPLLTESQIYFSGSIATVLSEGNQSISAEGKTLDFISRVGERLLIIIAGTEDDPDIFYFSSDPIVAEITNYKRRFVNASRQIPKLSVKINDEESAFIANNIPYKSKTPVEEVYQKTKLSLLFYESTSAELIKRVNDVKLPFGTNYSIIFAGDSTLGGFNAIVQQEF
jgi:hypothetical protein